MIKIKETPPTTQLPKIEPEGDKFYVLRDCEVSAGGYWETIHITDTIEQAFGSIGNDWEDIMIEYRDFRITFCTLTDRGNVKSDTIFKYFKTVSELKEIITKPQ